MKNNLIIGGSGLIGKALFKYLKKKDLACLATSTMGDKELIKFDLKTPEDIKDLELDKIGTVYITAAISSPDICNTKFDYAWSVNVEGTSKLIEILLKKEIKIIFLSTDTVYGDHRKPFDETMDVNPIGKYGFMKNHIEKLFLGHKNFKSVRLSYVFSRNDNFTYYLSSCFCNNREAEIFHPFFRSIIYLDDVIEGLVNISENWREIENNIINFGGPNLVSRLELAFLLNSVIFKSLRYKETLPNKSFFINRPKFIAMESPILKKILKRDLINLNEAINKEFKNFNKKNYIL